MERRQVVMTLVILYGSSIYVLGHVLLSFGAVPTYGIRSSWSANGRRVGVLPVRMENVQKIPPSRENIAGAVIRCLWLAGTRTFFGGSTWVLQARRLNGRIGWLTVLPEQINILNPLIVLIMVPVFEGIIYPCARK
ncbi:hypothetical protein OSTOST_12104, partial [Ostertagia ostertagi]